MRWLSQNTHMAHFQDNIHLQYNHKIGIKTHQLQRCILISTKALGIPFFILILDKKKPLLTGVIF